MKCLVQHHLRLKAYILASLIIMMQLIEWYIIVSSDELSCGSQTLMPFCKSCREKCYQVFFFCHHRLTEISSFNCILVNISKHKVYFPDEIPWPLRWLWVAVQQHLKSHTVSSPSFPCVCQLYMQTCFTNKGNFHTQALLGFWGVWEAELLHYGLSFCSRGNIVELLVGVLPLPNVSLLL